MFVFYNFVRVKSRFTVAKSNILVGKWICVFRNDDFQAFLEHPLHKNVINHRSKWNCDFWNVNFLKKNFNFRKGNAVNHKHFMEFSFLLKRTVPWFLHAATWWDRQKMDIEVHFIRGGTARYGHWGPILGCGTAIWGHWGPKYGIGKFKYQFWGPKLDFWEVLQDQNDF